MSAYLPSVRALRGRERSKDAHRLERTVRAASTASLDEGEFVRRLRRGGVLIRPRLRRGDDVVAGYSIAVGPATGDKPIWYGGGRLAGDARRAEQLTAMMHEKFAQVQQQLPEIPSKQNGPETRTVTSENETMRRATDGLAPPGTGSPLPATLRPGKYKTPATPRERDGLGRE